MDLTPRQQSVLTFIRRHQEETGIAPSVREIAEHFGLRGLAGVHRILQALVAKGHLASQAGKKRSWRLMAGPARPAIPLLGRIAAGPPREALEDRDEGLPVDPRLFGCQDCFALRVQGDSMIGVHIADGDLAILRPQEDAADGEIVAVLIDDLLTEATLKFFRRQGETIRLQAANPLYPDLIFTAEAQEKVRILGRLVGLIRHS
ncbi:MAG: transcriptional repressor LexA [Thermodesulfobacteriota bacterium]